jgi:hypothetical protein
MYMGELTSMNSEFFDELFKLFILSITVNSSNFLEDRNYYKLDSNVQIRKEAARSIVKMIAESSFVLLFN